MKVEKCGYENDQHTQSPVVYTHERGKAKNVKLILFTSKIY
jgi:hypothetical protein